MGSLSPGVSGSLPLRVMGSVSLGVMGLPTCCDEEDGVRHVAPLELTQRALARFERATYPLLLGQRVFERLALRVQRAHGVAAKHRMRGRVIRLRSAQAPVRVWPTILCSLELIGHDHPSAPERLGYVARRAHACSRCWPAPGANALAFAA